MKRLQTALLFSITLLLAFPAQAAIDAAWTASVDEKNASRMQLLISRGRNHQSGSTFDLATFAGLTAAHLTATSTTPVRFEMRREAGTLVFDGTFRNGHGAGQLTFAPNRAYIETVRALGVPFELETRRRGREQNEEEALFTLALHDVSSAFIRSMQAEGFRVPLEKYLALRIFDVTPEYIREMKSLGFRDLDTDALIGTRIHRVTPQYVREMRAAGWDLSLDDLQSSSIHGATPAFAKQMHDLGYRLDFDDLVAFRIHKVTPEFIASLRELGYANVDADDLVSMRIHRVTPEFIREIQAAGYEDVPVEKLVSMRIHGIDAKFLTTMRE